jgi:hypothetical protein
MLQLPWTTFLTTDASREDRDLTPLNGINEYWQ